MYFFADMIDSSQGSAGGTIDSSQGSVGWTQYTVSTQSSQDELPECLQLTHDWTTAFLCEHKLLDIGVAVNVQVAKQFCAAAEFCKISGLLCCYGLYQVSETASMRVLNASLPLPLSLSLSLGGLP